MVAAEKFEEAGLGASGALAAPGLELPQPVAQLFHVQREVLHPESGALAHSRELSRLEVGVREAGKRAIAGRERGELVEDREQASQDQPQCVPHDHAVCIIGDETTGRAKMDERPGRRRLVAEMVHMRHDIVAKARASYPGELVEAELETRGGRRVYEIDVRSVDGTRYELDFDAHTGELIDTRTEQDRALELRSKGTIMSLETIVRRAQERFSARFLEAELEEDDGRYEYEIELIGADGRRIEVKYDAASGELLHIGDD